MAKPELEFFDVDSLNWTPVEGGPTGAYEKIVSRDNKTGSYTRLLKFEPGVIVPDVLIHDFWEEVYILQGSLLETSTGRLFTQGMYACRPPGMKHGPYQVPQGCMTIEFRYYD